MRTAIFTVQATTLKIQTSEAVQLVQMGSAKNVSLVSGANTIPVGPGVFKVVSSNPVTVAAAVDPTGTTASPEIQVLTSTADKDGTWPDPQKTAVIQKPMTTLGVDSTALQQFFALDVRSAAL